MKLLLITLTAGIFAVTAAHAGDPNPSFHDGHWFHITKNGVRIHKAPTYISIKDGHWFHEAPRINGMGSYTRDRYSHYIEF